MGLFHVPGLGRGSKYGGTMGFTVHGLGFRGRLDKCAGKYTIKWTMKWKLGLCSVLWALGMECRGPRIKIGLASTIRHSCSQSRNPKP